MHASKKKSHGKLKYFGLDDDEYMTYQNLWHAAKALPKGRIFYTSKWRK